MAKVGFWLRGARGKLAGASMAKGPGGSTIAREIVTPTNPKTISQSMQRMKVRPAHKFYAAFSPLLNNAFEGVSYGNDSRLKFLSLAMTQEGPYIQKGVDRFIPASYTFATGSIPSVPVDPFSGGATVITLGIITSAATVTPEVLAGALGVSTDYQITIAVVNNVNGMFVPSYIGFDDRMKISELPVDALGKDDNNKITLNIAQLGLDASAVVAQVVVLSVQDASGSWLRSTQNMIISNELITSLYSQDALSAAIASYSEAAGGNSINSEWYYNLGLSQAWNGKLIKAPGIVVVTDNQERYELGTCVVGMRQIDGAVKYAFFVDNLTNPTKYAAIEDNQIVLKEFDSAEAGADIVARWNSSGTLVELWKDTYAAQLGF